MKRTMTEKSMTRNELEEIVRALGKLADDPLAFVYFAFPWGKEELKGYTPQAWQIQALLDIKNGLSIDTALQCATASGHGIGKSALVAWVILWAISTKADTRGVVTANTATQLETKTWAELSKWYSLFIGKPFFTLTSTAIFSNQQGHERTWRIDAIPWSVDRSESFAGLHNQGNRILLVFDEASAIDDKIWEVAEGALTDKNTEILWLVYGNPTRANGSFYDCFHRKSKLWKTRKIDSRSVDISNKQQIQKWVDTYGVDSDFVKIRVRGEFPSASDTQYISTTIARTAWERRPLRKAEYDFAPCIIGVDPAWTGGDSTVIFLRQGLFSMLLAEYQKNDNDGIIAAKLAEFEDKYHADAVFIDKGYGTGIYSFGVTMGRQWRLVAFGEKSGKQSCANKRAEMWENMKDWLETGGVIPQIDGMIEELTSPQAFVNMKGEIQLEKKEDMKRRGVPSPNKADALSLTFAYPVLPRHRVDSPYYVQQQSDRTNTDYNIFKKR